ncbi:MAG: Hsp20/alpha crystallin family protein [Bacteriovoracaceae bacterium]|nr:Hsp20/alpha crystallin family protein [Bacteriovoracaceae bacterium]
MSLFKNQSVTPFRSPGTLSTWQREMNSLFDRFNRDIFEGETGEFSPRIEVQEKDKGYIVCAEVPGIKESDINVTLQDNNLVLEGERKSESKTEEEGFYRSEFSYGSFYRSIPLADEINPDSVKASYKDGILTVEMNKLKPSSHKSKKIPILKS